MESRSAFRFWVQPERRMHYLGFRVAAIPSGGQESKSQVAKVGAAEKPEAVSDEGDNPKRSHPPESTEEFKSPVFLLKALFMESALEFPR